MPAVQCLFGIVSAAMLPDEVFGALSVPTFVSALEMSGLARYSGWLCAIGILAIVGVSQLGCGRSGPESPDRLGGEKSSSVTPAHQRQKTETVESVARFKEQTGESGVRFTYRNGEEAGHFAIVESLGGLYVGWGSVFLDFDRDGDEDIFVSNGHVIRYPVNAPLMQKPILLENRNGKRFVNIAAAVGEYFRKGHMGRGVAVGDIDNDGDQDLVVVHTNEPVALLSNETKNDHGWLSVRLVGTKSSRDPIGAVLFLETTTGKLMRQVKGGGSYASTSDPRVFFGLGKSKIKRLEIRWPSGTKQIIEKDAITPNRFMTIVEPR